jgi:hypothetical protein
MNRESNDYAGLGADDPLLAFKQRQNVEAWDAFRQLAKFKIGDRAWVNGNFVTLTRITPVGGGLVRIEGHYPGGAVDGRFPPSAVSAA